MSIKNSLSRSIHIDLHRFIYESPSKPTDKLVIVPQHCCALEMAHTAEKIKICLTERERSSSPSICWAFPVSVSPPSLSLSMVCTIDPTWAYAARHKRAERRKVRRKGLQLPISFALCFSREGYWQHWNILELRKEKPYQTVLSSGG